MRFLTLDDILQLHALVLSRDGGADGVHDIGRLEAVITTQYQKVFGGVLYSSEYEKAGAIIRGIARDHPFSDGNKRTAMLAGLTFLELNGYRFSALAGSIEDFAVSVATNRLDVSEIATWLKKHTNVV